MEKRTGEKSGSVLALWPEVVARAGLRADAADLLLMRGNVYEIAMDNGTAVMLGGDWLTRDASIGEDGSPKPISDETDLGRVGTRLCLPIIMGKGGR